MDLAQTEIFRSALLVEDEPSLTTALQIALNKLRIPNRSASTLREARKLIDEKLPDFILLDRNLPDGDGLDLCTSLRQQGFYGSILILTAKSEVENKVHGLQGGADDYLAKPFSWEELEARILALSRRKNTFNRETQKKPESTALWTLDSSRLRIFGPQGWVQLTPLEFKLAAKLITSSGQIVSRDELLKDVWGFTFLPKTRTVDHFLGRLRKHFEKNPEMPDYFITVRGAGYRFEP